MKTIHSSFGDKISLRNFSSSQKRREALEKELNIKLNNISNFTFTENQVNNRNIENLIGATQIPLGVAGPLAIKNLKFEISNLNSNSKLKIKNYFIPLATTEGALVASISRGCKVITESGGAKTFVEEVGMSRGPVFKVSNLEHGMKVKEWIENHTSLLSKVSEKTSSHLKLLDIKIALSGKNLFVRFSYLTADAMGMNMVTIATEAAVLLIEKETKAKCIALAGNFDLDKKPGWLNFIEGRGKKVWAEVIVPKKVVLDILKTNPEKIVEVIKRKAHMGSVMSGSLGFNSHFANIVAALFLATGQDPAHVVEGSLGISDAEVEKNGDLYFSIFMPSIQIGTVGGGINLPTQKEALQLLNTSSALEFAHVLAGAVLAGELSLIASLAENSLVCAHKKLGRKGGAKSQITKNVEDFVQNN